MDSGMPFNAFADNSRGAVFSLRLREMATTSIAGLANSSLTETQAPQLPCMTWFRFPFRSFSSEMMPTNSACWLSGRFAFPRVDSNSSLLFSCMPCVKCFPVFGRIPDRSQIKNSTTDSHSVDSSATLPISANSSVERISFDRMRLATGFSPFYASSRRYVRRLPPMFLSATSARSESLNPSFWRVFQRKSNSVA